MWNPLEFLDEIFSGGGSSDSPTGGSVAQWSLGHWSAQIPYIGPIVGYYLTGREDLSDLTRGGDPSDWADDPFAIRTVGDGDDGDTGRRGRGGEPAGEHGVDDAGRLVQRLADPDMNGASGSLLKNPNLLADNSPAPPARFDVLDYRPDPLGPVRPELSMDFGPYPPPLVAPSGPVQEVVVRGVRPDRSAPVVFPGFTSSTQVDGARPPMALPRRVAPAPRPELTAPARPERSPPPAAPELPEQWTEEVVISAPMPFQPLVSHPQALETAQGMGHIEVGDLVQFGRGGYNGLISAVQTLGRLSTLAATSQLGPVAPLVTPYAERPFAGLDDLRLSIDPRYGGAGIMGEQLFENLAFEGLPLLPQAGNLLRRALSSERLLAPAFWFMGAGGVGGGARLGRALRARRAVSPYRFVGMTPVAGEGAWAEYQVWSTGTDMEAVFATTRRGKTRHILVDALTGDYLVEAKFGNMGQMWRPEREAHILRQARDYLAIADARSFSGVRYMVSTEFGAERLGMVFAREFPAAVESGRLSVWFVPPFP